VILRNIFWKIGLLGDYKRPFWKFAFAQLRRGDIESLISVSLISHHLITYAREASRGHQNASNYSLRLREAQVPAE
jgi:hopanoid C-2 methylase